MLNFATDTIHDVEGDRIPAEAMLMVTLADRRRVAIRPSGTEPKIKYYMFGAKVPRAGKSFTPAEVAEARESVKSSLARLWENLSADAKTRLG